MILINSTYFCAAVIFSDVPNIVTIAAPILGYMKGWSEKEVIDYCKSKKWEYQIV